MMRDSIGDYLNEFGERVPEQLKTEHRNIRDSLA